MVVELHVSLCTNLMSAFIGLLVIGTVSGRLATTTFCVKSSETAADQCSDSRCSDACHSLMYYANQSNFTTDNATVLFLAGKHFLWKSIYTAHVSNVTFIGEEKNGLNVKVLCNSSLLSQAGFFFNNVTNLRIEGLQFLYCSQHSKHPNFRTAAVTVYWIRNLTMNNVVISNAGGVGLLAENLYGTSHINDTIIHNSHKTHYADSHRAHHTDGQNFALYCSSISHHNGSIPAVNTVLINNSHFLNGRCCSIDDHDSREFPSSWYYNGSKASGVYIHIACQTKMNITLNNVTVVGNNGYGGGNVAIQYMSHSTKWLVAISIVNSYIAHGYGNVGGGLYFNAFRIPNGTYNDDRQLGSTVTDMQIMPLLTVTSTIFYANTSPYLGAGVKIQLREGLWPMVGKISFNNCTFKGSRLYQPVEMGHGGVAVHIRSYQLQAYVRHTSPLFKVEFTECKFTNNTQHTPHTLHHTLISPQSHNGVLYVQGIDSVTIKQCRIINNGCTGIIAIESFLLFYELNVIQYNTGVRGGGMVLCSRSIVQLHNGTSLNITNNYATEYGGGIYVESECDQDIPHCFFQVDNANANISTLRKTKVALINNNASFAGSAIYGGMIDHCVIFINITQKYYHSASRIFNATFHIYPSEGNSVISSDPIVVCFCRNKTYSEDCVNNQTFKKSIVPGSHIRVPVMMLGQRNSCVPGIVKAKVECRSTNCTMEPYQQIKETLPNTTQCTELEFTIYSGDNTTGILQLVAEGGSFEYSGNKYRPTEIILCIEKCPLGSKANGSKCEYLLDHTKTITDEILVKSNPPIWIGYKEQPGESTKIPNTTNIIHHRYCPLGYCQEVNKYIKIRTTYKTFDQDIQCAGNRSGLLCGKCRTNYSLGFGSSQCLRCQSEAPVLRVIGLIAVCAVAGVLLVVLLTLLNLTVAEGTLNGLIFYANILQVNQDLFFPPETHARPLTAVIAWLNLDFGITVCFYDGMDAYAKTWLQFLFPLYIWLISGGIVYFSWKSNRVARLTGKNAVKVLATLFLLSFGKLIRTVIAAASYTNVLSFDGKINISVWLPDANIHYLHGKHTPLYVVAGLTVVMVLLYTLILTFIQCLRRAPNHRVWVWVRKLKPLLDAYTGPYKDRYHFWTGFLLLVRVFLFASFAFNLTKGPKLNFTLTIIVSTLLMLAIQPGIYRHQFVGLLEGSMYVNLILFSAAMMFSLGNDTSYKTIAAYLFGGWALLTFLGIISYHIYKQVGVPLDCDQLLMSCKEKLWVRARRGTAIQPVLIQRDDSDESEESEEEGELDRPSWSTPHVREPLIGSI